VHTKATDVDDIGGICFPLARTAVTGGGDPLLYWETMNSMQTEDWCTAMKEEMDASAENYAWELVDNPKNLKVLDNCWVLRMKLGADGTTQRLRARLVVKGYAQKAGIDYDEAFNPVARYDTV
jgi:hypothetical protein